MSLKIIPGKTDVTVYFKVPSGSTITNIDISSTRKGETPSAAVAATALGAANSAHADNSAIYVDAVNQIGLLRVDFQDLPFATGNDEVELVVNDLVAGWTEMLRVQLEIDFSKYPGGAVYYDASAGNTNTLPGEDGTFDNPVSTPAAAKSIADALGSNIINIVGGSYAIDDNYLDFVFNGKSTDASFDLNGQATGKVTVNDCNVTGIMNGGVNSIFNRCIVTPPASDSYQGFFNECGFEGNTTITMQDSGLFLNNCYLKDDLPGQALTLDFFVGGAYALVNNFNGDIVLLNMDLDDVCDLGNHQGFLTIDGSCNDVGSTLRIKGRMPANTDNSTGGFVINTDAVSNIDEIYPDGVVYYSSNISANTKTVLGINGTKRNPSTTAVAVAAMADLLGRDKKINVAGTMAVSITMRGYYLFANNNKQDFNLGNFNRINVSSGTFDGNVIENLHFYNHQSISAPDGNVYRNCSLINPLFQTSALAGVYENCIFGNGFSFNINGNTSIYGGGVNEIDVPLNLILTSSTELQINNMNVEEITLNTIVASNKVSIKTRKAKITLAADCTAGTLNALGDIAIDESLSTTVVNRLLNGVRNISTTDLLGDGTAPSVIEDDGAGNARWTVKALEQAPSGISGDATEANQNTIIALMGTPPDLGSGATLGDNNQDLDDNWNGATVALPSIPNVETGSNAQLLKLAAYVVKLAKIETPTLQTLSDEGGSPIASRTIAITTGQVIVGKLA